MPRWKFTIEFDGTRFLGWQRQKQGRTVQEELETALSTFCRTQTEVTGQGRTDRGVHAEAQVAHADLPEGIAPGQLLSAMRGLLPADMAVLSAEITDDNFHSRFDAVSRRYRYQIATRPVPLQRKLYWVVLEPFDCELLHQCSELITGEKDFRNFAKEDGDKKMNTRCVITLSEWIKEGGAWIYRIEGDRFLRHMVRRIVGTSHRVASGRMMVHDFRLLLEGEDAVRKGHSAPPEGLILEKVRYE